MPSAIFVLPRESSSRSLSTYPLANPPADFVVLERRSLSLYASRTPHAFGLSEGMSSGSQVDVLACLGCFLRIVVLAPFGTSHESEDNLDSAPPARVKIQRENCF